MRYFVSPGHEIQHDGVTYSAGAELPEMARGAIRRLLDLGAAHPEQIAHEVAEKAIDEAAALRQRIQELEAELAATKAPEPTVPESDSGAAAPSPRPPASPRPSSRGRG